MCDICLSNANVKWVNLGLGYVTFCDVQRFVVIEYCHSFKLILIAQSKIGIFMTHNKISFFKHGGLEN